MRTSPRSARWLAVPVAAVLTAAAACGSNPTTTESGAGTGGTTGSSTANGASAGGNGSGQVSTGGGGGTAPGVYSEVKPGNRQPATKDVLFRVYVPNEVSGTVSVIDPTTMKVVDTFPTGTIPQHVVPSYDLSTLYVLNNSSNTVTPIDPKTGKPGKNIKVEDPYNLYYTIDGSEAIVVEEANQTLTFVDPKTFAKKSSLKTECDGINHMDFSADGSYAIVTCEFEGTLIKVDMKNRKVVGKLKPDVKMSGKQNPLKNITQPQDVRVAPDGKTFYMADLITDGVYVIDGDAFTITGFEKTGVAAHGLYPSRDGRKLYVINRGTNAIPAPGSFKGKAQGSVAVLDFATGKVEANWPVPNGGSPDMGNLTEDGTQLWLGGRYDAEVYVFDTVKGELINRIPVGQNPHGLTVWPQPGRFSLGHTGNMR